MLSILTFCGWLKPGLEHQGLDIASLPKNMPSAFLALFQKKGEGGGKDTKQKGIQNSWLWERLNDWKLGKRESRFPS